MPTTTPAFVPSRRRGFTLIEILIVVIILGVLAAIVLPNFTDASGQAREAAFRTNLRDLAGSAELFFQKHGSLPTQAARAPVPAEMFTEAGRVADFSMTTPVGGYWHVGFIEGQGWGVGVWWPAGEEDLTTQTHALDEAMDDGDPATGRFVSDGGQRYYWIIG